MLIGTMIPIPKVKRQVVCDSNNFRAITVMLLSYTCNRYYWQSFKLDYFNERRKISM